MRQNSTQLRLSMIGIIAISLFAALFARLWYLQVLATDEFELQAEANQQRTVIEPAPRGRILDRQGRVLVDNRLSFVATVDRQRLADLSESARGQLLARLATTLSRTDPAVTVESLQQRISSPRYSPYTPAPVAADLPEDLAVELTERDEEYLGVVGIDSRAVRVYPNGQLAAHVLGYVGAINDEEFATRRDGAGDYQLTDEIGKSGVELVYEEVLRGQPGIRVLEVDSLGRTIRELSYRGPVAGSDLVLTIDMQVQAVAETALQSELERARSRTTRDGQEQPAPAGSVVVTEPSTGAVLAMASYPTYNPNTFTDGIDDAEWATLTDEANHLPLLNRAIQGEYAPGSTFKLITAYAGLASGAVAPETVVDDGGVFRVPGCSGGTCTFRNSGSRAWGRVDLRRALTVSSDVYFYTLGARFWAERSTLGDPIQESANQFGLGADTGIPLPNERSGWIPTPENKAERNAENPTAFPYGDWYTGDNVNLAIGQGDMLLTPLQLTNAYATLANGGTFYQPSVVAEIQRSGHRDDADALPPPTSRAVPLDPNWRVALMDGFTGTTLDDEGTAAATFAGFPNWNVAGKTGTAQVTGRVDTALFVGMAPAEAPQYMVGAVLEEAGFGGVAAAPLVRQVLEPLASPGAMPEVIADATQPAGYRLSQPLAAEAAPGDAD